MALSQHSNTGPKKISKLCESQFDTLSKCQTFQKFIRVGRLWLRLPQVVEETWPINMFPRGYIQSCNTVVGNVIVTLASRCNCCILILPLPTQLVLFFLHFQSFWQNVFRITADLILHCHGYRKYCIASGQLRARVYGVYLRALVLALVVVQGEYLFIDSPFSLIQHFYFVEAANSAYRCHSLEIMMKIFSGKLSTPLMFPFPALLLFFPLPNRLLFPHTDSSTSAKLQPSVLLFCYYHFLRTSTDFPRTFSDFLLTSTDFLLTFYRFVLTFYLLLLIFTDFLRTSTDFLRISTDILRTFNDFLLT